MLTSADDLSLGMNDVLPKPFTKEGLLSMLEKHLGHLKKPNPGMNTIAVPPVNSVGQIGHLQSTSRQSLKDETSPVNSPATVSTNWNSPLQPTGVSPVANGMTDEYIHTVRHPSAYGSMDGSHTGTSIGPYGGASANPLTTRQLIGGPLRRGIGDISGGEDMNGNVKRQMYAPVPPMQGARH